MTVMNKTTDEIKRELDEIHMKEAFELSKQSPDKRKQVGVLSPILILVVIPNIFQKVSIVSLMV